MLEDAADVLDWFGVTKKTGKSYTVPDEISQPSPNVADNLESKDCGLDVGFVEVEELDDVGDAAAAVWSGVRDGEVDVPFLRLEGGEVRRRCCSRASSRLTSCRSLSLSGWSSSSLRWRVEGE